MTDTILVDPDTSYLAQMAYSNKARELGLDPLCIAVCIDAAVGAAYLRALENVETALRGIEKDARSDRVGYSIREVSIIIREETLKDTPT